jgi:hypothetical protein
MLSKPEGKKMLSDYRYYLGSGRQALDYKHTTDFLINHIKKTYDEGKYIATALKELTDLDTNLWAPMMKTSSSTDADVRAVETKQFEIQYTTQYNKYEDHCHAYRDNKVKAYGLLWERCTKVMKNKIKARSDFEVNILNNPIELLKAIKEHLLNYQETRYTMSILVNAVKVLFNAKQKDGKSLQVYTK